MADDGGNILLVIRKNDVAARLAAALQSAGFQVPDICGSGSEALRTAGSRDFDIMVAGCNLPDTTGLALSIAMLERRDCGVILITTESEKAYVERTASRNDITCLVRPVGRNALLQAVALIRQRRRLAAEACSQRERLQQLSERRVLVARAKSVLMQARGMSEPEAFRALQKASMDTGIPVREIARMILETEGKYLHGIYR